MAEKQPKATATAGIGDSTASANTATEAQQSTNDPNTTRRISVSYATKGRRFSIASNESKRSAITYRLFVSTEDYLNIGL